MAMAAPAAAMDGLHVRSTGGKGELLVVHRPIGARGEPVIAGRCLLQEGLRSGQPEELRPSRVFKNTGDPKSLAEVDEDQGSDGQKVSQPCYRQAIESTGPKARSR